MADNLSREERVAAGLKKLKQFQQRANKKGTPGVRKKSPTKDCSPCDTTQKELEKKLSSEAKEIAPTKISVPSANSNQSSPSHNKSTSASSPSLYDSSVSIQDTSKSTSDEKSKSSLNLTNSKELSSTESILQISQQINGLMSETHAFLNGDIEQEDSLSNTESHLLAQRNQELASENDRLRQSNDHLQFQIQETKSKVSRLQREFEKERQELLEKSHKEQVTLKDQLQVHIQTIGILVAEKTELQSSLSLSQQTAKQKAAEVEELQGRLRASRQRANDIERELNNISTSNQQFEKGNKESSKEIDRLKMENYKLGKTVEDVKQQNAEMSEKISKKLAELQTLEKELDDTRSKLSLAELYAQQLSSGSNVEDSSQMEKLHHDKLELEKKVSLHKESIEKLIGERDQMSEQYQAYIQQLCQQVTSLRDELRQNNEEKESLAKDRNALTEKLESLSSAQDSLSKENNEEFRIKMTFLEEKNKEMKKELETQVSDNAQMSNLVQEQETRICELESSIQRMREDGVDKSKLIDSIQSEKVAASRAVAQNMELKRQLAELQNGFITMSNDKLDLTEKLLSEQHITKELGERLSQQEEELKELKEQVSIREDELQNLHHSNTKVIYQQNQIADRMRHYEAHGQVTDIMRQELEQAKERINVLINQNTELRMALAMQAEATVSSEDGKEDKEAAKRNNLVQSLSASVRQLEMERNQMMNQLEDQKQSRTKLEEQIKNRENCLSTDYDDNDIIPKEEHDVMKRAMSQLEERFKKTMDEIAELSEEKQRLEHLVLQLQGETETIGDYIALYQIQRGLMRKRASEKDDYIAQLAKDREDLKSKLSELQNLMVNLVEERKLYHSQGIIAADSSEMFDMADERFSSKGNDAVSDGHSHCLGGMNGNSIEFQDTSEPSDNTAKKIMDLLSEIGTTNLVDKPVVDNFHPCPICSGRLMTV